MSSRKVIYFFSRKNRPAYTVKDGERVVIETKDAFSNTIKSPRQLFEDIPMRVVNPATGPIAVRGLAAGETLSVSIEKIRCGTRGILLCSPELGNLAREVRRSRTKIIPIKGNRARLSDDLEIQLNPHIGVIGVSPSAGEHPTFHPGDFGGNMDTTEVGEGSKVHLPTFVDGGMVAVGDVHAAMGDGEVCGTGIEVAAEVILRLARNPELQLVRPMIETPTSWITYSAAKTLDEASRIAASDMVKFIMNSRGVDFEEAYMLASVAADLKISQVVDPLMAAKMSISKRYL